MAPQCYLQFTIAFGIGALLVLLMIRYKIDWYWKFVSWIQTPTFWLIILIILIIIGVIEQVLGLKPFQPPFC